MEMTVTKKLSWEEVLKLSDQLADKIRQSGTEIDILVGLARGGWVPTRLLSDRLQVKKLASIGIGYEDAARTKLNAYSLPGLVGVPSNILLIEDRLESGKSLQKAVEILAGHGVGIKTACYFFRPDSVLVPDYYIEQNDDDIIFPWE